MSNQYNGPWYQPQPQTIYLVKQRNPDTGYRVGLVFAYIAAVLLGPWYALICLGFAVGGAQ